MFLAADGHAIDADAHPKVLQVAVPVDLEFGIAEDVTKREQVAAWYEARLAEIPGVEIPYVAPETTRMSWFVYVIRFDAKLNRDEIAKKLEARGVPVRPYFLPIHLQPYMVEKFGWREGDFPVTEDLGRRGLAVPFCGVMNEEQVEYVCQSIRQVVSEA